MRERLIEARLVRAVNKVGGKALKLVSPGCMGVPDRIVLLPGGRICFVELKASGKRPRAIQEKRIRELRALGFSVYVLDSFQAVDRFMLEGMES